MPPIFTLQKREKIKEELLKNGIALILEMGIQKMTIQKVTAKTAIGKGTFYHFFDSKESYVWEVIKYNKEMIFQAINEEAEQKNGIDKEAFARILRRFSVGGENNIIASMTREDEKWLIDAGMAKQQPDEELENHIMQTLFKHCIGLKEDINFHVVANMIKTMALMVESKEEMYQEVLRENLTIMEHTLCDYIFY